LALLFIGFLLEHSIGVNLSPIRGLSIKNLVIMLMIVEILHRKLMNKKPSFDHKNMTTAPIVLFILYCFCSLVINMQVNPSLYGSFKSEIIFFKSYMDPFLLSLFVFYLIDNKKTIESILFYFFLLLLAYNTITIIGSTGIIEFAGVYVDDKGATRGSFTSPNQYAAYNAFLMPFCLSAFQKNRSLKKKIFYLFCFLTGVINIFWVFSRAGLLSLFIGIVSLQILNAKRLSFALIIKIFSGILIFAILTLGVLSFLPENTKLGIEENTLGRYQSEDLDDYSSGRLGIWEYAINLYLKNPFFGTGWKTFVKLVGANSHNEYINFLVSTGAIGLLLYLFIYYRLFITAFKYRKRIVQSRWYFNAYIAGLFSFLNSLFFSNMFTPLYYFFIFSAVILKLGYISIVENKAYDPKSLIYPQSAKLRI
jgi:O-antigen ligase